VTGPGTITLSGGGISVNLPPGWEGRIGVPASGPAGPRTAQGGTTVAGATSDATPDGSAMPVTHLATFSLPADRGDFGSGAVDVMGGEDVLIALVEYGPECVDTPLFARGQVPAPEPNQFRPEALQRIIPGQVGYQRFFTHSGRAFCLYVVLGSGTNARRLTTATRSVLSTVRITPS
jgi:hypothetical protein